MTAPWVAVPDAAPGSWEQPRPADTHLQRVRKIRNRGRVVAAGFGLAALVAVGLPVVDQLEEPDSPRETVQQFLAAEEENDRQRMWDLLCMHRQEVDGPEAEYTQLPRHFFHRSDHRIRTVTELEGLSAEAWQVRVSVRGWGGDDDRYWMYMVREDGNLRVCWDPR